MKLIMMTKKNTHVKKPIIFSVCSLTDIEIESLTPLRHQHDMKDDDLNKQKKHTGEKANNIFNLFLKLNSIKIELLRDQQWQHEMNHD